MAPSHGLGGSHDIWHPYFFWFIESSSLSRFKQTICSDYYWHIHQSILCRSNLWKLPFCGEKARSLILNLARRRQRPTDIKSRGWLEACATGEMSKSQMITALPTNWCNQESNPQERRLIPLMTSGLPWYRSAKICQLINAENHKWQNAESPPF